MSKMEDQSVCREHAIEIYELAANGFDKEGKTTEACLMTLCMCMAQVQFALNDINETLKWMSGKG